MLDVPTIELLKSTLTVDMTTIGARSGRPTRIEIWAWWFEDSYIITGTPGPRDWMANVRADPAVVVHIGGMDLDGHASPIDDSGFRRRFFQSSEARWYSTQAQLDRLVEDAPMIEITFD